MPHLAGWTERALRFTNVTDQTGEGRTSDAEFAALVSVSPPDQGAVAFRFDANHYVGLPSVLSERGYATLSAVPFEPGFWNRRALHPSYGFKQSLFQSDFELTDQIGWGLNDHDFLQQMMPRLAALPRPFAAWLITLSLHHPFDDFPDRHKVLDLGPLEHTSFGNYLHTMNFFDRALADFQTSLARTGLLSETVLAVFGDHDAGFQRDLAATMGVGADDGRWELSDRVPFFVRLPRDTARFAGARSVPAGQTDVAPTLLALMGVDPARLPYMGRNLLGQAGEEVVLRPNGNWIGGAHLFIDRGASDRGRSCFALETALFVDAAACRAADGGARRARDIALRLVTGDLQQRLREALAASPD
jgi:phosphoglycerol transferase MdoB-like AlkP superfamily enzyme